MFSHLILGLRSAGLPTSITEHLALMGAMKAGVADYSVEDFYYLARATLVKDERHLDKFDRVFAQCFKGLESEEGPGARDLPEEWLLKLAEKLGVAALVVDEAGKASYTEGLPLVGMREPRR